MLERNSLEKYHPLRLKTSAFLIGCNSKEILFSDWCLPQLEYRGSYRNSFDITANQGY